MNIQYEKNDLVTINNQVYKMFSKQFFILQQEFIHNDNRIMKSIVSKFNDWMKKYLLKYAKKYFEYSVKVLKDLFHCYVMQLTKIYNQQFPSFHTDAKP